MILIVFFFLGSIYFGSDQYFDKEIQKAQKLIEEKQKKLTTFDALEKKWSMQSTTGIMRIYGNF